MSDASMKGREDFWDDVPVEDNPFEKGTQEWEDWREGWASADADYYDSWSYDFSTRDY